MRGGQFLPHSIGGRLIWHVWSDRQRCSIARGIRRQKGTQIGIQIERQRLPEDLDRKGEGAQEALIEFHQLLSISLTQQIVRDAFDLQDAHQRCLSGAGGSQAQVRSSDGAQFHKVSLYTATFVPGGVHAAHAALLSQVCHPSCSSVASSSALSVICVSPDEKPREARSTCSNGTGIGCQT